MSDNSNNTPLSQRELRHELNNRINNIQMNAELIRTLAERENNTQIEAAARRILQECELTAALSKS